MVMAVISKNNTPKLILFTRVKKCMTQEQIQTLNESFIPIICNIENMKIIQSTMGTKKRTSEIIRETGIPQTTCYRRINQLVKMGLLQKSGYAYTESLHRECYYLSIAENIEILISKLRFRVSIH